MTDFDVIVASFALESVSGYICCTHQTTQLANMDTVSIAALKQFFLEKTRSSVRNEAITFHLSESDTSVARPAFLRLAGQFGQLAPRSRVEFVIHHMLQALVECWSNEDWDRESLSRQAVLHDFVALLLVLHVVQVIGYLFNCDIPHEWSTICFTSLEGHYFGSQTFH